MAERPFGAVGAPLQFSIVTTAPIGQALGRFRLSSPRAHRRCARSASPRVCGRRCSRRARDGPSSSARISRPDSERCRRSSNRARDRIEALQKAVRELGIVSAMVMKEKPAYERPSTWVRRRGAFMDRVEQVYAAVPVISARAAGRRDAEPAGTRALAGGPAQSADAARDGQPRLGAVLRPRPRAKRAKTSASQGSGAVASRAARLAGDRRSSSRGWSLKALHRLIVMSATYRQASRGDARRCAERDPDNRLLARGPRFRVEAEMVRDIALAAQRAAVAPDRRTERVPAAARRDLAERRTAAIAVDAAARARTLSPRPVHLPAAHRAVPGVHDVRRPQPRGLHRPPRAHEHAAAGADDAERHAFLRGGARRWRAGCWSPRPRVADGRPRARRASASASSRRACQRRRSWTACVAALSSASRATSGRTRSARRR